MQLGRHADAVRYFRKVRDADPTNAQLLNNLGVSLKNIDEITEAAEMLRHAIRYQPNYPEAHNNLGAALEQADDIAAAAANYLTALELNPEHPAPVNNLKRLLGEPGVAALILAKCESGCASESVAMREILAMAKMVSSRQDPVGKVESLTAVLQSADLKAGHGDTYSAIETYRAVLEQLPNNPGAWNNLGVLLRKVQDHGQAMLAFTRATQLDPQCALAWNNLGSCHLDLGDLAQAHLALERAEHIAPDLANVQCNLGMLQRASQDAAKAMERYQRALALDPRLYEAHFNLGNLRYEFGDAAGAKSAFAKAVEIAPQNPEAAYSLGVAEADPVQSLAHLNRALSLRPAYAEAEIARVYNQLRACDWTGLWRRIARISEIAVDPSMPALSPFWFLAISESRRTQLACARKWAREKVMPGLSLLAGEFTSDRSRKTSAVRVGMLSGDLREHAVGELLKDVLPLIDARRCELFAYDASPDDDSPTRRTLLSAFKAVRPAAILSTTDLAKQIAADGIDVLVDLSGFTQHSRSKVLALRPAPVQVSYLGFPGSMGWDAVDYLVADDHLVPALHATDYDEGILRLPHCYQPARHFALGAQARPTRESQGLPAQGMVFACFGNAYKLRPEMFECWLRLLKRTPRSVLWFARFNDAAEGNLRSFARHHGVDPSRLVFAPVVSLDEHSARLGLADLFLDTAPYGSGITAAQTLYAGVPLLTVAGQTYVGRMASSLLHKLGLNQLIAGDLEDYEQRAVRLAHDSDARNRVRGLLESARTSSPVFDSARSAQDLQQMFLRLAETHHAKRLPRRESLSHSSKAEHAL